MIDATLKEEILKTLESLAPHQQEQVLAYSKRLQSTPLLSPTPGKKLIELADMLDFSSSDLEEMIQAIDEDCERIDWEGWV